MSDHDYWAPPPGRDWPDGYPRCHPGVWAEDALEILPAHADVHEPGMWRAARLTGVGASDVSALLGLTAHKARMEVWEQKRGELPDDFDSGSEEAFWGTRHEPNVRAVAAERLRIHIIKPGTFRSVRWPWLLVNPDGIVHTVDAAGRVTWPAADGYGLAEGYEGKTAIEWLAPAWRDGVVPDHAELQCQTAMAVLGFDGMHVACLIGGNRLVLRYVARDDELIKDIIEITEEFWHDYVLTGERPPPDGGPACEAYLMRRYPHAHAGTTAEAPPDAAEFIRASKAQEAAAATYVKAGREGKNLARALTGDRETLIDPDGDPVATWRHTGALRLADLLAEHPDETKPFMVKAEVFDEDAFAEEHPELWTAYRTRVLLIKGYRTTTRKDHEDG